MTCSCGAILDDYFDGYADVYEETVVGKTRTEHKCCECRQPIPAGTRSVCRSSCLYEGEWTTLYRCGDCSLLVASFAMQVGGCPPWGMLQEAADDHGVSLEALRGVLKRGKAAAERPQ